MAGTELEGTELPAGDYAIEGWKAFLWADATRNDEPAYRYEEDALEAGAPGQLVPHTMCQHIVYEATGGIDATLSRFVDDWTSGAALGGLRVEFHAPLETDQTLHVEGTIDEVVEKEGSSGPMTIVTQTYEVTATDGSPVYDLEVDIILLEGL